MITPASLAFAFGRNVGIIKDQVAGLSQADSLIQLPFRANCLNWVVGHIITNRLAIFKVLGVEDIPFDAASLGHYEYDSRPITGEEEGVLPLEQLIAMLEQTQTILTERLGAISAQELERPLVFFGEREMPVAEWVFFFYFHDCYHTGQTEILRQAAGKNDKII
ncbi:MAG: DinB family protein [Anaerolineales bacterium]|nr:DinB family protein [Anaerolineales bacterium]